MKHAIIGALLLTISVQCQEEADMDLDKSFELPDTTESGRQAGLAAFFGAIGMSIFNPTEAPKPPPPQVASPLSLSKQVGLRGVHSLITRMSDHDRRGALRQTKRMYCGRMDACDYGRQMMLRMGPTEAERVVDRTIQFFDSVMMGIHGHDCHNMYRGCIGLRMSLLTLGTYEPN
ncbi:hypothetical protein MTO96_018626 [Rhipicephalus appendiculatus]